jgi:hypothetical protein
MNEPINPTAWLWQQLEMRLPSDMLAELRAGYKAQSDRYGRAAKIRQIKREIGTFEKCIRFGSRPDYYRGRIAKRTAQLAQLEADDAAT